MLKIRKHNNRIRLYLGKNSTRFHSWFKSQLSEFTTFYLHTLFISLILFLFSIHYLYSIHYCKQRKSFLQGQQGNKQCPLHRASLSIPIACQCAGLHAWRWTRMMKLAKIAMNLPIKIGTTTVIATGLLFKSLKFLGT